MNDFRKTLNHCLNEFGFNQVEVGPLGTPLTIDFYEEFLNENNYGTMFYLKDHFEAKKNPQQIQPTLKSVISISQAYFPLPEPTAEKNPARVALYAQNNDYHYWLKEKLQAVIEKLKVEHPEEHFLPFVDSGPVLERNWGYENRLGWFGKNTCLIHPQHGSLFFIAEILTSLEAPVPLGDFETLPDFCGKCQKCIEVCPTGALTAPRKMQADRCISYLTIEAKEPPPVELRPLMHDWFFGCDLCQTVCPWNEKLFRQKNIKPTVDISAQPSLSMNDAQKQGLISYFRWLLGASHKQIQKKYVGTALARPGGKGLKRNALIVIGNRRLSELRADVEKLESESLSELQKWTLEQLATPQ